MNADKSDSRSVPEWYKQRGYPHFDRPLTPRQAMMTVGDPNRIASRAFLPFITFDVCQRRYKKMADGERALDVKRRTVAFASHTDSCIFSYYAHLLRPAYEGQLHMRGLHHNVTAYRRFRPSKCNVHFAGEAFEEIERRGPCVAVAIDIEKFFDTIPHAALKRAWCQMLGVDRLPPDHFAVFKAVTRWARVDRAEVMEVLQIGRRRQENWRFGDPLCTPQEFRDKIRGGGLISQGLPGSGGEPRGIPQGSPMSALLSNLVMLDVDAEVAAVARDVDVYYRRYSDDILLVGSVDDVSRVQDALKQAVGALGLSINDEKTAWSDFSMGADGQLETEHPLQYLGFTFDGQRVVVRPQTVAKFIQRMKRSVKSAQRAARAAEARGESGRLHRQELYARYSHLGPTQQMRRRNPNLRSSFYSYAARASDQLSRDEIKRQLRKHWPRLAAEIAVAEKTL